MFRHTFSARITLISAVAAVGLLALIAAGQAVSPDEVRISSRVYEPQSQILRAESRLVRVNAVVRDGKGRIVSGLKQSDFAVFDDGKPQTIETFNVETHRPLPVEQKATAQPPSGQTQSAPAANPAKAAQPRYVALYFDDLHTKSGDMGHVRQAAEDFLNKGLTADDQVALFTASSTETVDFTSDPSKVIEALGKLESHYRIFDTGACPRITPHDAYMIVNIPGSDAYAVALAAADQCNCDDQANMDQTCYQQQKQLVMMQAQQIWEPMKELSKNTLETIQGVVNYLATKPGERVLVLASSGFLTGTLETKVDTMIDNALRAGIVINALDAKGLYAEDPSHGQMQNELDPGSSAGAAAFVYENENFASELASVTAAMADFALGTGGRFFHNRNDLTAGYYSLAVAPETEYLLGFAPEKEKRNGSFHKLKVEVTVPGKYYVQTRPGYFATKEGLAPVEEPGTAKANETQEKIDAEVSGTKERSDFPLSINERLGAEDKSGRELQVETRVDIAKLPFEKQQDRHVDALTFVIALFDPQGRLVAGKEAQMDLALKPASYGQFTKTGIGGSMSLEAPPGAYRLRVVVAEAAKGEMSAATRNVQIPSK